MSARVAPAISRTYSTHKRILKPVIGILRFEAARSRARRVNKPRTHKAASPMLPGSGTAGELGSAEVSAVLPALIVAPKFARHLSYSFCVPAFLRHTT